MIILSIMLKRFFFLIRHEKKTHKLSDSDTSAKNILLQKSSFSGDDSVMDF